MTHVVFHHTTTLSSETVVLTKADVTRIGQARSTEFHIAGAGSLTASAKTGNAPSFVEVFADLSDTHQPVDLGAVTEWELVATGAVELTMVGFDPR